MSALGAARRLAPTKLRAVAAAAAGALVPGRHLRRRMGAAIVLAFLVALLLGGMYMLWLRDSGLVAVEQVEVTGLTGRDAERVRAALDNAARGMTTLHVDRDALQAAVDVFPVVEAIEVQTDFPHAMRIKVIQHTPVAVLVAGDARIPVAGDGSVLAGLPTEGSLPEIHTEAAVPERRLAPGVALDSARVAGGAPGPMVERLEQIERDSDRGLVVGVADGPELIFGTADRVEAKWAAALRVLADPDAAGAQYIDVRIPERPAAGGLAVETVAPVAPATEAVPVAPELEPGVAADPAATFPEAVPETSPDEAPPVPAGAPGEPVAGPPADPGGGAAAYPQP